MPERFLKGQTALERQGAPCSRPSSAGTATRSDDEGGARGPGARRGGDPADARSADSAGDPGRRQHAGVRQEPESRRRSRRSSRSSRRCIRAHIAPARDSEEPATPARRSPPCAVSVGRTRGPTSGPARGPRLLAHRRPADDGARPDGHHLRSRMASAAAPARHLAATLASRLLHRRLDDRSGWRRPRRSMRSRACFLTAHMAQHLVLTSVAPPLILLGAPVVPLLRGLPRRLVRDALGPFLAWPALRRAAHRLTHPGVGLAVMTVAMWGWHVPGPYQLALQVPFWHGVEHVDVLRRLAALLVVGRAAVAVHRALVGVVHPADAAPRRRSEHGHRRDPHVLRTGPLSHLRPGPAPRRSLGARRPSRWPAS